MAGYRRHPGGLGGALQAGLIEHLGNPDGSAPDLTDVVAHRLLGGPGLSRPLGHDHRAMGRSVPVTGTGIPAWTELSALRVDGEAPSVLAFLLCRTPTAG